MDFENKINYKEIGKEPDFNKDLAANSRSSVANFSDR